MTKIQFNSISPLGNPCSSVPIGKDIDFQNWTLCDADKLITPFGRMFIYIGDKTHEDGILSLKKPAAFTITASDTNIGLTYSDFVKQIRDIVYNISENPNIFSMRSWLNINTIFLDSIYMTTRGDWYVNIHTVIWKYHEYETILEKNKTRLASTKKIEEFEDIDIGEDD